MYPNGNPTRCLAVTEHEDAELCESEPNKKRAAGFFTTTELHLRLTIVGTKANLDFRI
jgi:hypothetical protein